MPWVVAIADEFEPEFDGLPEEARTEILALSLLLEQFGPRLGRPRVDTLKGSRYANMKELRFSAAGESGASRSLSIPAGGHSCLWRETNREAAGNASIASCSERRTCVSTPIWCG